MNLIVRDLVALVVAMVAVWVAYTVMTWTRRPHPWIARRAAAVLPYLQSPLALVVVGLVSELVYLAYFVGQFPLLRYYNTDTSMQAIAGAGPPGLAMFLGLSTLLFLLCGLAWWQVREATERAILWIILGFGALFGLTMSFVYPITANDVFAYVNQSRVLVLYHRNPIFTPAATFPRDPWVGLSGSWSSSGAPYGPLGILVDALPTFVVGDNFLLNLILLKILFAGLTVVGGFLAYHVIRGAGFDRALPAAVLVAWNPALLIEIAANGHNDAAMMLLVLVGLLLYTRNKPVFGMAAIVASALVKYATGLLIPLFFLYGLVHQRTLRARVRFVGLSALCSFALVAALYGPFWHGADTFTRALQEDQFHIESFDSVAAPLFSSSLTLDQATMLGRLIFLGIYLYALWLSTRRLPDFLRACFLSIFFFLVLGAGNVKTWYAVWPAVAAAVVPHMVARMPALLLAWGATLSASFYGYIWPWLGGGGFTPVNYASYAISFVPAVLVLVGLMIVERACPAAPKTAVQVYDTPARNTG